MRFSPIESGPPCPSTNFASKPARASSSSGTTSHAVQARRVSLVFRIMPGYLPTLGALDWLKSSADVGSKILTESGDVIGYITADLGGQSAASEVDVCRSVGVDKTQVRLSKEEVCSLEPPDYMPSANKDSWFMRPVGIASNVKFLYVGMLSSNTDSTPFLLEVLLAEPGPWGAFTRSCFAAIGDMPAGRPFAYSDIDVIAVTTDRARCVAELLKSIRAFLPAEISITIIVQTPQNLRWRRMANKYDARLIHVPHDTGLGKCRNIAVQQTNRKLVFLMDDDFQIDERCRLDAALDIIAANQDISVLGGNLLDTENWTTPRSKEISQGFAMHMIRSDERLLWLRLEDAPRKRKFANAVDYFETCDIVDNFALMRRDRIFDKGVFWNENLKIGAEHQDFYVRLKRQASTVVARTNALKVRNVRVQSRGYKKMRYRIDYFFNFFFRDLRLKSFTIVGERQRVFSPDGRSGYLEQPNMQAVFAPGQVHVD